MEEQSAPAVPTPAVPTPAHISTVSAPTHGPAHAYLLSNTDFCSESVFYEYLETNKVQGISDSSI